MNFRGFTAPALLKHCDSMTTLAREGRKFPGLYRPGLIEAVVVQCP